MKANPFRAEESEEAKWAAADRLGSAGSWLISAELMSLPPLQVYRDVCRKGCVNQPTNQTRKVIKSYFCV